RRPPGAAARRRRLRGHARARARQHAVASPRRGGRRARIPGQDDAGVPRRAGLRARVSGRGADAPEAPAVAARRRRRLARRRRRPGRTRAAVLLWGGWLLATGGVFSFMTGIIHPYSTTTLAPPIAVLVGVGATLLWQGRRLLGARLALAAMLIATAAWSYRL